ncbi:hypothetical protein WUBG_14228, partial [Wuchereria bancrofti]
MQHFTYFQALQTSQQQKQQQQQQQHQQQQQQSLHDTKTSEQTNSISTVDISEDSDTQVSPSTKDCAGLRNKRSYSGSGQTISQLTKERLKTMITSKMNRIRSESSNVSQATTSTVWTTSTTSSTTNSENIYHHTASWSSCMEGQTSQQMHTGTPIALSSLHFEPYYIPSTMHAVHGTLQPSDYQLRKVSSEPNLKMRIRAKLLNKSAGPLQSQSSAFAFTQRTSQSGDAPMDTDLGGSTSSADSPTTLLAASPHLIIPSPSLPNLTSPAPNTNGY